MKPRHKQASPGIEAAIGRSVDFELTIVDIVRRSERRAWFVACCAVLMSLILAGGYFYFLPLKEKVPYLVMADAYTGTSTVARLDGDFGKNSITINDAINRSNVAHFVLARESYDVALMNLRDWTTVYTMSSPGVASAYTTLHATRNPDSPFNTYGRERAIRVRILSIVLLGGGPETTPKGATVRFQRSLFDKATGESRPMDGKIATLEFAYKSNLSMDEKYRIENPLGFQVTSYRVDNDYAVAPPLETEAMPPAALPAALSARPTQAMALPGAMTAMDSPMAPDRTGTTSTLPATTITPASTTTAGPGIR
jgi:type IV secretion system protein VirB8